MHPNPTAPPPRSQLIAVFGAAGRGHTELARALHAALQAEADAKSDSAEGPADPIGWLGDDGGPAEQQATRLVAALQRHRLVVTDSHALLPGDPAVAPTARAPESKIRIDLCLLATAPHPPEPGDTGDADLRFALLRAGQGFSVLTGNLPARLQAALDAWYAHQRALARGPAPASRWRHACGRCGDADCERHLFEQLHRSP